MAEQRTESHHDRDWRGKSGVILFALLLAAATVTPFFFMGKDEGGRRWYEGATPARADSGTIPVQLQLPETHDLGVHFDQMRSFYAGQASGKLYPRWQEDTNRGFGAPTMTYYSPGIYFVTSAFYALTRDWWGALWGAHILLLLASALAFYLYARRTLSRQAALVAMTLYTIAPYHLVDQYQRGAIAELLIFVWMPLILFFIDRLLDAAPRRNEEVIPDGEPQTRLASTRPLINVAGLAASYGAALWSHVPTAFQLTVVLALVVPLLAYWRRDWRGLLRIGAGFVLGLGLAGVYLYPAVVEQGLIHSELLNGEIPYQLTYLFTQSPTSFPAFDEFSRLLNLIWSLNVLTIVVAVALLFVFKPLLRDKRALQESIYGWLVAGMLASFMMLSVSDFLRHLIPKLEIGVFSWRLLSVSSFAAALLVGACAEAARNTFANKVTRRLAAGVVVAVFLASVGVSIARVILPMRSFQTFESRKEHLNRIMIPSNVRRLPRELPLVEPARLAREQGQVVIDRWEPEHRRITVTLTGEDLLLIRTFHFPGWAATIDGKEAAILSDTEIGAMQLELPAGTHVVELEFGATPARWLGGMISLFSLAFLLALLFAARVRAAKKSRATVATTSGSEAPSP